MSIDFTILCTEPPAAFLAKKGRWFEWDSDEQSGSFGGMYLSQQPLYEDDPLPAPEWAERVVAVIHANGRLTDDTYDAFDRWMTALAEATRGAIYSSPSGEFEYVWADYREAETRERAAALIAAGDFEGIARWVGELAADHAATTRKHRSADAITAYRARFPEIADQAEQAIEDARAYFAP